MLTRALETAVCRKELPGDGAWTGAQLAGAEAGYVSYWSSAEVDGLASALRHFRGTGKALGDMQADDFPLPLLGERLAALLEQLTEGSGFAILRGLPIGQSISEDDAKVIQWGLTKHLGEPVPQNSRGHLLGHVIAKQGVAAKRRTYESNVAQVYHSDGSDVVSLLCVRQARSGGESTIASSVTIHNIMLQERLDLLERLYRTFYHSRMGEEREGETPFYPCPMYAYLDGYLYCRPGTSYIKDAQRFDEVPRLSDTDLEALEWWKSVPLRSGVALNYRLQAGDVQFLNNYTVVHGRSEYEDYDDPKLRRYLVRVLFRVEQARAFTPEFDARRAGIPLAKGVEPNVVLDPEGDDDGSPG